MVFFFHRFFYHAQHEMVVCTKSRAWLTVDCDISFDDLRGSHSWRLGMGRQSGSHA
jgi:hypothetical protein